MVTKVLVNNTCEQEDCIAPRIFKGRAELDLYYGDQRNFPAALSGLYGYLTNQEINRAKRFVFKRDERTYVISHALVNKKISEYLQKDFKELKINYFDDKKPFVEGGDIDFNLSHSRDYFAFAVGRTGNLNIGVDIEVVSEAKDFESIVNTYFHENERRYILNNDLSKLVKHNRFYELWTRKEAFLKMLGIGLTEELNEIDLSPGERGIRISDYEFIDKNTFNEAFVSTVRLLEDRVISLSTNSPVSFRLEECRYIKNQRF